MVSSIENCTVDITVPLPGGKVHGSLARAGKVRGQTPKVDAQFKKKKKTGRAKRREQFHRRFVSICPRKMTGEKRQDPIFIKKEDTGKKTSRRRGPNANT